MLRLQNEISFHCHRFVPNTSCHPCHLPDEKSPKQICRQTGVDRGKKSKDIFQDFNFLSGALFPHSPESNYSHEGRRRRIVYQRSDVGDSETHEGRREGEEQNEMTSGKKLDCALRRDDGRVRPLVTGNQNTPESMSAAAT